MAAVYFQKLEEDFLNDVRSLFGRFDGADAAV